MSNQEDVSRIALSLPETTQKGDGYFVKSKFFVWTYQERVEPKKPRVPRPDVLVVRVDGEGEKRLLLASDPTKFFTTAHYNGYPAVLVRLPEIENDELTELITDAWRIQAPKSLVKKFDAQQAQG
jgi:hypothetical protein